MIRQFDLRSSSRRAGLPKNFLHDRDSSSESVEQAVRAILHRVQRDGDHALRYYEKKFSGVRLASIKIPEKEIRSALKNANPKFVAILKKAAANIRRFHLHQRRSSWKIREQFNSDLRQLYLPIERVGVYVPGGRAAYPSTVLMNVIPAQVAGVKEIHLVSPPDKNGKVNSDVLLAAAILNVRNVYCAGGAQAIAALAFGTEAIPAVDKIVGPGNIFVATAKRLVFGIVGIDSFAGPSEVVILADDSARTEFIASDMIAQAEHDERASSILVTTSGSSASHVEAEIQKIVRFLPRRKIIETSLKQHGAIILVRSLTQGVEIVNLLAPEHLEIVTKNQEQTLKMIKHAGSIFLGNYSPVALGDYFAGTNHVLPTGRTARFSSPLSVDDFVKKSSVTNYSKKKMNSVSEDIAYFAEREGLTAHAFSLRLRGKNDRT
ncbi:MAG: histidinol dehydrogenase [Bacteroidota bacterium]|nr:histidinol dehydrogenase [Bacteroidota bacterium]